MQTCLGSKVAIFPRTLFVLKLAVISAVLAGTDSAFCGEVVRVKLKWKHQAQFAGYYVALENKLFEDVGLDVELLESSSPHQGNVVDEVLSGDFQFGITDCGLLVERLSGKKIVALATIFQHSPQVILTLESSGISNLHEIKKTKVMFEEDCYPVLALLKDENVEIESCVRVPHTRSVAELVNGDVKIMSAYLTDEPFLLRKQGISFRCFYPSASGIDFYDDVLFTSEEFLRNHPDIVEAFLNATRSGWDAAFSSPEDTIKLIRAKYSIEKSEEHLQYELNEMRRFTDAGRGQIGFMNSSRWLSIAKTFQRLGYVSNVDLNELNGFTYPIAREHSIGPVVSVAYAALASGLILAFALIAQFAHTLTSLYLSQKKES